MTFEAIDVIDDERPHGGPWNMAADEILLAGGGLARPVLRFYRWERPTVSLGCFESLGAASSGERSLSACVRRWTGGGVVRHGEDLTYSLLVPKGKLSRLHAREVYRRVHGRLGDVLRAAGIPAVMAGPEAGSPSRECFRNPVACDVMVEGSKIAGAAQRWTREGLLHQGSIQGIALPDDFRRRFAESFAEKVLETPGLLDGRRSAIEELAERKYGSEGWLRRVP